MDESARSSHALECIACIAGVTSPPKLHDLYEQLKKLEMNSLRPFSRGLVRSAFVQDPWVCSSCARASRSVSRRISQPRQTRSIQTTPKSSRDASPTTGRTVPTQEQLREPFKNKNQNVLYETCNPAFNPLSCPALLICSIVTTPSPSSSAPSPSAMARCQCTR